MQRAATGKLEVTTNRYRVSIYGEEKVVELDSGNGHTTLWIYLMPLNCILYVKFVQIVKMVHFMLFVYFFNKKL